MAKIEIVPVEDKTGIKDFISLPKRIYASHPGYIAPLDIERMEVLEPKKNPYFTHAKAQLFLAKQNKYPALPIAFRSSTSYASSISDIKGR